mmetsp:Transcript_8270/g.24707  ORF Transcript_8270/g.24707 Transcript_8270/m.24707 type:complete len:96 (+) Transcript_8270:1353-1640(+)
MANAYNSLHFCGGHSSGHSRQDCGLEMQHAVEMQRACCAASFFHFGGPVIKRDDVVGGLTGPPHLRSLPQRAARLEATRFYSLFLLACVCVCVCL